MNCFRIILGGAWVGACSIAAIGGAYLIMHSPAPWWEHIGNGIVRIGQYARATIRISAQLEPIIQQLEQRPAEQQQPQSGG